MEKKKKKKEVEDFFWLSRTLYTPTGPSKETAAPEKTAVPAGFLVVIPRQEWQAVQLPGGGEARYAISPDAILSVEDGSTIRAVTYWRVSRPKAPRPAISPAVCRGWRNCSKPASPRKRPCWPRPTVLSSSARLQEQAPRHREAEVGQAGADRVSDPQGPPYQRARRRLCGEGRLYRRRQSLAA